MAVFSCPFDPEAWKREALLTAAQMRQAESLGAVSSSAMMSKAGEAVARVVMERWKPCRVVVLCGPGNNGGDGYVVAARLRQAGWPVVVGALTGASPSVEAKDAAAAWTDVTRPLTKDLFDQADLVVDALFGVGLTRPLDAELVGLVENLNARKLPVVAVDVLSGVDADTGRVLGAAVQAALTVTFFCAKPGHVVLPGALRCGEVVIADIGIARAVLDEVQPTTARNAPDLWRKALSWPQPGGHKYSRGQALLFGGPVLTGAARLAARAAQRVGAGLVTLAAPTEAVPLYAAALESVIVRPVASVEDWRALLDDPKRNAVLIGPGMGLDADAKALVHAALATRKPCVLDADALTAFAGEPQELFGLLHEACVLTPHEGEFSRLFGARLDAAAPKLERARRAAALAGCVVLLKGADTVVASPDGCAVVNDNAPPWLATAGAGDVLAGLIVGLLAQGLQPMVAASAAAWLHGRSAAAFGPGLIAEDIVDGVPVALKSLSE